MEAEIIRMVCNLYRGDENSCGIGTSGGTESNILACLAYREQYKVEKGITTPNIVCSQTAHVSFDKAAHYFDIELRKVPLRIDMRADIQGMRR
jgi:sphinganine-1-phosphate aldolase